MSATLAAILVGLLGSVGGGSAAGPSTDTGIYLGNDDQVTVRGNSVTNYVTGVGSSTSAPTAW
jgi:hypothetical protein